MAVSWLTGMSVYGLVVMFKVDLTAGQRNHKDDITGGTGGLGLSAIRELGIVVHRRVMEVAWSWTLGMNDIHM